MLEDWELDEKWEERMSREWDVCPKCGCHYREEEDGECPRCYNMKKFKVGSYKFRL